MNRKSFKFLQWLRIIAGAAVLILTVLLFTGRDFGWMPRPPAWSAEWQMGPAILNLLTRPSSVLVLTAAASLLLLALLFGRVYCSFLCPLGVVQDLLYRLLTLLHLRRKEYHPLPAWRRWRLAVLVLATLCLAAGIIMPIVVFEPYAFAGRLSTLLVTPLAEGVNLLLLKIFGEGRFAWLYPADTVKPVWPVVAIVAASFLLLLIAVWRWGRIYCNSLCPVGALLSMIGKISIFKLAFVPEACRHCRSCVTTCKAGCIDRETQSIDFDRCVVCFNCAAACRFNGVQFVRRWKFSLDDTAAAATPTDNTRRDFLVAAGTVAAGAALLPAAHIGDLTRKAHYPVMPPGAESFDRLASRCVSCHLCVASCPTKVIRPATLEYGLSGLMMPMLDFRRNMCEYDCNTCSQVCPSGALIPLTQAEKHRVQIGKVKYFKERCVIFCEHTDCGACAEHCPTQAVTMKPWQDGLSLPFTDVSICVGCGACEHICPVRPERAIIVEGGRRQEQAQPPPRLKTPAAKKGNDGFPF